MSKEDDKDVQQRSESSKLHARELMQMRAFKKTDTSMSLS